MRQVEKLPIEQLDLGPDEPTFGTTPKPAKEVKKRGRKPKAKKDQAARLENSKNGNLVDNIEIEIELENIDPVEKKPKGRPRGRPKKQPAAQKD